MTLIFDNNVHCEYDNKSIRITGPLGQVQLYLGKRYINHGNNFIEINDKFLTKQNIRLLKHLNNGLIMGYRKRIYQSGVWTIMKKSNNVLAFKLGFSHITYFQIPTNLVIRSRLRGQFRILDLFSLSYQLVADTAARLIRLRKADVYRLNGFRYANKKLRLKVGKKK